MHLKYQFWTQSITNLQFSDTSVPVGDTQLPLGSLHSGTCYIALLWWVIELIPMVIKDPQQHMFREHLLFHHRFGSTISVLAVHKSIPLFTAAVPKISIAMESLLPFGSKRLPRCFSITSTLVLEEKYKDIFSTG